LIDFGIASKIHGDMTSVLKDVTTGTWNYMSPECIRSGGSNFQGHKVSWLNFLDLIINTDIFFTLYLDKSKIRCMVTRVHIV